ncbi:uncharacterized protein CCOS01_01515 [Colletotrichum costaricense]|uniref:Uncharacterized protein n=1 Tax=Colletotrichum costaricense TaxID=1209916 RepID=A0AAI9ZB29_9PEZI|nr:uncharacterized protein CCOS01_01515 [Colletotrichum costaricense]KAK1540201.1 hypothetical protein CCOS01_01515 [Colletotrichum costaricense]
MGFPWGIVVVLKRDWTPISRIRKRYEFDGSGRLFFPELIVLQKDTIAWLPRQESFRKAGDYREWVYIALYYPSLPVLLDANGSGSIHWDSLEDYEHPYDERLVEIPVSHLSAEVFILRDFVPRVPEYDALAARYPPGEVGIFLKGDIATHEDFSIHPPMILRVHGAGWTVNGQRRHCLIPYSLPETGLAYILPRVDARIDVTTSFLRIGIRIVKDYGPGVPKFDSMTPIMFKTSTKTSTNTTQAEKESSKAGDIAVCDHFATIDVPDINVIKKLYPSAGKHSGYRAFGIEQAIPRDFVEYGLQMTGSVAVKN